MSEECSDYVDCRIMLEKLASKGVIDVIVTKHATMRLLERKPRSFKKVNVRVLADTIRNVIRDGYYKGSGDNLIVRTKSYVLICSIDVLGRIIVKTVMSKTSLSDRFKHPLRGYRRIFWKTVTITLSSNVIR